MFSQIDALAACAYTAVFVVAHCHDGEQAFKKVSALFRKHSAQAFVFSGCNDTGEAT